MKGVKAWAGLTWVRFLGAAIIGLVGALLVTLTFQAGGRGADFLRTLGSALVVAMIVAVTLQLLFEKHLLAEIRESQEALLRGISQRERAPDPVLRALEEAPEDDEDLSPDDLEALQEGHADLKEGRVVPHEEVRRRLVS